MDIVVGIKGGNKETIKAAEVWLIEGCPLCTRVGL
jgi:hypothetical protein